ncbi:MAG: CpsD/CapB family tyrosine-protein kinase [Ruminococcaceae bacterium]|nr:CpsD/CapB family tyrosine-protein kinase [Oscillospiraceae bacterium]
MGKFKNKVKYGYEYGTGYGYGYGYGYGSYSGGSTNGKVHEAIKTLRSNIKFSGIDNPIKTIVITSSIPGEGKSTISHFLAIEMAKAGNKTLIVECDLRRPTQGNLFKVRPKKGLTKYLSGDCTLEEAAAVTNTENLYFLDVDSKVVNPVEMLGSERFKKAMEEMREKFDIVIFDTLPLTSFIEGALVAANADATIMVIRAGYTPQRAIMGSLDQLEKANANIIGTVLNGIEESASGQYYGYYKYRRKSRYGKYNYDSYDSYYAEIEKQEQQQQEPVQPDSPADDFSDLLL